MASRPSISRAELEVARVLWKLGRATPRQVFEAFPNRRKLDFATVQTYLRRLESKGYLRAHRKGQVKSYSPRVQPSHVVRDTIDEFLATLFDGDALPLMQHLIQNRNFKREELEGFRQMLRDYESEDGDDQDGTSS